MTKAVVTGLGVVAPNGLGTEAFWSATLRGQDAIRPITRFDPGSYPTKLAGEVLDFEASKHIPSRLIPQTDRMTQFALTAADWAITDSAVDTARLSPLEMGVITASAAGGLEFGQRELQNLWRDGPDYVSAYHSFAWFYAVNTGQISIRHDMRGPTGVFVAEQAGGLVAIAHARRVVREGTALVLTGGMDSTLCPFGMTAQVAGGQLSTREEPARTYLPFDRDAAGHVPGEGGAILVVEDERQARERDAPTYGEIVGYGSTFDPRPGSGRPPNLRRAIEVALDDAGLNTTDIAVVFADAAGVAPLDRVEAEVLVEMFGPHGVPVTAPKTMTGRLYSGGAPVDVALALLALRDGVIPPTTRVTPCYDLDVVLGGRPRPFTGSAALVLARGNGGFNSALVVSSRRREGR
ncbi:beta-ketoacyl synthase [Prauserella marina]|uniref:Act minimal PKS chain-length factor (CLF/KS beta) n=1 Tax=Prauserella marina TaxID=530584 RepID=A0A222VLU5_9PSEU|nr:ketosynthase chain-length factor [Prauserella marina]ASR34899.1 beta-ketoacyl synthase [Prauserella marina]PWV85395.1 act minimal PKS chain-length factor (CLF/KS beta) [Prauserella marina]SDC55860.1 act minimal PKS chain-length factor (CLF/KS beta) [Prauserella marina]